MAHTLCLVVMERRPLFLRGVPTAIDGALIAARTPDVLVQLAKLSSVQGTIRFRRLG